MKCAEVQLNLGALVLGGLEPEEAAQTKHHLASCPNCQDELKELEEIGQALKAAPPPKDPPAYLKDEILSRVRAEKASSSGGLGFEIRRFILPGVAAAAVAVTVALGVFFSLQTKPQVAIIELTATEENEDYWGVADLSSLPSGNQHIQLKLNNLDDPGADNFYEAWFTSGEKYISAGSFTATSSGQTDVWLTAPPQVRNYDTLLITKQPITGDPTPTDETILKGEVA